MNILSEFDNTSQLFEQFRAKMYMLIVDLLESHNISIHKVESRVKDRSSLEYKISRKSNKYSELSDITDIVGIRIITYLESDVDKVAKIIEEEFQLDVENSIDKRILQSNQFGYRSLHYVVSCLDERLNLFEYRRFDGLKFEIQIRSVLQHAWAEIEHDLGYKGVDTLPSEYKRAFNRLAALLETADVEFDRLKKELSKYESTVDQLIDIEPENVSINQASLLSLLNSDPVLVEALEIIKEEMKCTFEIEKQYSDMLINTFTDVFQMNYIKDIQDSLKSYKDWYLRFVAEFVKSFDYQKMSIFIPLFYLQHFLSAKDGDSEVYKDYLRKTGIYDNGFIVSKVNETK